MAQNLSQKKNQFCQKVVELAEKSVNLVRDLQELIGNYNDNLFGPGQTNQFIDTDLDFPSSTINHLTPALIDGFISAAQNISTLTPVQRQSLRRTVKRPLGGNRDN